MGLITLSLKLLVIHIAERPVDADIDWYWGAASAAGLGKGQTGVTVGVRSGVPGATAYGDRQGRSLGRLTERVADTHPHVRLSEAACLVRIDINAVGAPNRGRGSSCVLCGCLCRCVGGRRCVGTCWC